MEKYDELTYEEGNLLRLITDTRYGEVTIKVRDGVPVMASVVKKDVKLDENKMRIKGE